MSTKGVVVILLSALCLLFVSPLAAQNEETSPLDHSSKYIQVHLGEQISESDLDIVNQIILLHRLNGQHDDADMIQRTVNNKFTDAELDLIKQNDNQPLLTIAYDHYFDPPSGTHITTWITRVWWYPNYNLHYAHASSAMPSMHMRVRAWNTGGGLLYDNTFGFAPASDLHARNHGGWSGTAQSDGYYNNGLYTIHRIANGTY
jgi:hypothetical protein